MNKQTDTQPNNSVEANDRKAENVSTANNSQKTNKSNTSHSNLASKSTIITGIALIVAALSCVGSAYTYWQQHSQTTVLLDKNKQLVAALDAQQLALQQFTNTIKNQENTLDSQFSNTNTKITTLETQTKKLQTSQETLVNQIAKMNTDASQTWMLFEAKQLLKQAFFRLRASDIQGASKLLEDINETIKQRGDLSQSANKVNQSIEEALLKLQQVKQTDIATLYSQLAAIQTQIAVLPVKEPHFYNEAKPKDDLESRWDKLSNKLSNYVRVDFNANNKTTPILTAQGIGQLKMTLDLSIEKAQWAAISGQPTIYQNELSRVTQFLNQYFDANSTQVKALISKIDALKNETLIVETPDLTDTLRTINTYLDAEITTTSPKTRTKQPQGDN